MEKKKSQRERQLAGQYYKICRKFGRDPLPPSRRDRLSHLYPDRLPEAVAEELDGRRVRSALVCLAGTLGLMVLLQIFSGEPSLERGILQRPEPGTMSSSVHLEVQGQGESLETSLTVNPRAYTEEEVEDLFRKAAVELQTRVLGKNPSLQEISQPLDLSGECSIAGMEAYWIPREPEWILSDGSIQMAESPEGEKETVMDLYLQWEGRERHYEVPVILLSDTSEPTWEEQVATALRQAEAFEPEAGQVVLPECIGGVAVNYHFASEGTSGWMVCFLGLLVAVLMFFLPEQRLQETEEERRRELECGYPELLSQLCILTGAGLTVRGAWERIVWDYKVRKTEAGEWNYLYEEMERALHALGQGIPEEQMYSRFGRRCGLPAYLRLGGLLESHIRNGTRGFAEILEAEREEAFRERLQLARKQGEEVGVKLLFPMLMLFGLVAAVLVIPAFLSV